MLRAIPSSVAIRSVWHLKVCRSCSVGVIICAQSANVLSLIEPFTAFLAVSFSGGYVCWFVALGPHCSTFFVFSLVLHSDVQHVVSHQLFSHHFSISSLRLKRLGFVNFRNLFDAYVCPLFALWHLNRFDVDLVYPLP